MNFPEWSDLGGNMSQEAQDAWQAELGRLQRAEHYFSGGVFQEYAEKEAPSDPDVPLFPAGINLVKNFCMALTDAMFGDWSEKPIQFGSSNESGADDLDARAIALVDAILDESGFWPQLWEAELDRNKFGGCALRVSVDPALDHHIRWSRVYRDSFFPIWNPEQRDELLAAWFITRLTPEQANAKFGVTANHDIYYAEFWSRLVHETYLGKERLLREANPFDVVPAVYIPRLRSESWWGDSLVDDVIALQDEINMRIADIGDVSAANAHPIVWGKNLPRGFTRENFPRGSNKMWDLGRSVGDYHPEVGVLEPKSTIMPTVFEDVKLLLKFAREAAQTPAIAYGDDDGGGQRSGDTLEIRLRSLLSAVMRSRAYMNVGIRQMLKITAAILKQKSFATGAYSEIGTRTHERLVKLLPAYAEVLPRRQPELVDEVVKLLATDPPAISLETAVKMLGRNIHEVENIKEMLADEDLWKKPVGKAAQELEEKKMQAQAEQAQAQMEMQSELKAKEAAAQPAAKPAASKKPEAK